MDGSGQCYIKRGHSDPERLKVYVLSPVQITTYNGNTCVKKQLSVDIEGTLANSSVALPCLNLVLHSISKVGENTFESEAFIMFIDSKPWKTLVIESENIRIFICTDRAMCSYVAL